ncbi:MAG: aromatic acid exporter family protein [Sporolactobacillus sp.]
MRIGARSLKTGISVALALLIATYLHMTPPIMAGIAAAVTTQPSVRRSMRSLVQTIYGNLIGAIISIIAVFTIGDSSVSIGLVVILVIAIHLKFNMKDTLSLTMVTTIFIMASGMNSTGQFIVEAIWRLALVCIGVLSATMINLLIIPPKYEDPLYDTIVVQTTDLLKWVRLLNERASNNTKIRSERAAFDRRKLQIENYYHWFREERIYSRKKRYSRMRRIVVYRQMILVISRLHRILDELDRNENTYRILPDKFRHMLRQQIDGMMAYHERVLLKFDGKIRRKRHEEQVRQEAQRKSALVESFAAHFSNSSADDWLDLFPLIATVIDYSKQVSNLDRLVNSYQEHH